MSINKEDFVFRSINDTEEDRELFAKTLDDINKKGFGYREEKLQFKKGTIVSHLTEISVIRGKNKEQIDTLVSILFYGSYRDKFEMQKVSLKILKNIDDDNFYKFVNKELPTFKKELAKYPTREISSLWYEFYFDSGIERLVGSWNDMQ